MTRTVTAKRWPIKGRTREGARPLWLYVMPDRSTRVQYSDGARVRYRCWSCALRSGITTTDIAPARVIVPANW